MAGDRGDKAERLLNLTLALLDAKRPLTKQEIFENVAGYSGKPESMERMFERDKDELREIGITIDVLPIDPLFDDELGYRIHPSDYFLPEISLTRDESIWVALAANVLRELGQHTSAQDAVRTLLSRNSASIEDITSIGASTHLEIPVNAILDDLWRAIKQKTTVLFTYGPGVSIGSAPQDKFSKSEREISPYTLISRYSNWYLVGKDLKDNKIKTFRVGRLTQLAFGSTQKFVAADSHDEIASAIESLRGENIDEVHLKVATQISTDHRLARRASQTLIEGEYMLLTIKDIDLVEITEMVLWAGASVEVLAPQMLRERIVSSLQRTLEVNS